MNKIGSYLNFHAQALSLRSRRNEVLASNIANAATPNFKARDLDFDAEIRHHIGAGPLRTTDDQHLPIMVNPVRDRMLYRDRLTHQWMATQWKWRLSRWNFLKTSYAIKPH